jgi:sulfide:quinone oxidoreductase
VRHEIVCVLDDLDRGVLVYRDAARQVVLPPLRVAYWLKPALERMFLRRYAPPRRTAPQARRTDAGEGTG